MTSVISDATVLIVLAKLQRLDILKALFAGVIIPEPVYREIVAKADYDIAVWQDSFYTIREIASDPLYEDLCVLLDPGESAAIALAAKLNMPLIIDEKKGRTVAASLSVPVIGLVGIILALKKRNLFGNSELLGIIDDAMAIGFRLSDQLYADIRGRLE